MSTANEPKLHIRTHFNSAIASRIQRVLQERYIHTPHAAEFWFLLEDLLIQVNPQSPTPKAMGCLLTGKPHSGKTTIVRQFKKAYLDNVVSANSRDIIYFQIPSRMHLKGVIAKLGRLLKIPDISGRATKTFSTTVLIEKVAKKLILDGSRLVIIDEFQKLFELSTESRVEILSGFNDLVNESHVPIILVGVEGVNEILDLRDYNDSSNLKGTFCSRFPEYKLQPWTDPYDLQFINLLKSIYKDCQLGLSDNGKINKIDPFYMDDRIRKMIIELTEGLTGKIIRLLKWTSRNLIHKQLDQKITTNNLRETAKQMNTIGW